MRRHPLAIPAIIWFFCFSSMAQAAITINVPQIAEDSENFPVSASFSPPLEKSETAQFNIDDKQAFSLSLTAGTLTEVSVRVMIGRGRVEVVRLRSGRAVESSIRNIEVPLPSRPTRVASHVSEMKTRGAEGVLRTLLTSPVGFADTLVVADRNFGATLVGSNMVSANTLITVRGSITAAGTIRSVPMAADSQTSQETTNHDATDTKLVDAILCQSTLAVPTDHPSLEKIKDRPARSVYSPAKPTYVLGHPLSEIHAYRPDEKADYIYYAVMAKDVTMSALAASMKEHFHLSNTDVDNEASGKEYNLYIKGRANKDSYISLMQWNFSPGIWVIGSGDCRMDNLKVRFMDAAATRRGKKEN